MKMTAADEEALKTLRHRADTQCQRVGTQDAGELYMSTNKVL